MGEKCSAAKLTSSQMVRLSPILMRIRMASQPDYPVTSFLSFSDRAVSPCQYGVADARKAELADAEHAS